MEPRNNLLSCEVKRPDGALLRWGAFGSGATVIFVPGLGGDSLCWGAVPRLVARQGFKVLLYDPRGLGRSTLGDAPATVETLRDDLLALVELQEQPVILFGWSMGSQLSLMAALESDVSKVKALALVAAASSHKALAQQRPEIFGPLCDVTLPLDSWCCHMAPLLGLSTSGKEAMVRQLTPYREGLALHQRALAQGPKEKLNYHKLHCTVSLLAGRGDILIPLEETQNVACDTGGALHIVSGGHGLIFQEPLLVAQWFVEQCKVEKAPHSS